MMDILLIAYEFPPICSAQALRWHYLVGELARMGHRVKVLTTDFMIELQLSPSPVQDVDVVRCFPGPFVGGANKLERRFFGEARRQSGNSEDGEQSVQRMRRLYHSIRTALDHVVFPDVRTEWYFFAARALRRLARAGYRPHVVIGSHEPAVDLQLAIAAKRLFGAPFLADLADPVETVYTPHWRRRIDRRYEGYLLGAADGVIVTLESVKQALERKHPGRAGRIEVIPQGFDHRRSAALRSAIPFRRDRLNILFSGTLYESFRNPARFLETVARRSEVQLWLAGNLVGEFPALLRSTNIRVLGPLTHAEVLDAQQKADVLLSVGNRQADQIPGKIYEYFGAKRPILHVFSSEQDPSRRLVQELRRGWHAADNVESSEAILDTLVRRWRAGELEASLDLSSSHADKFSWRTRAERLIQFANTL